MASPTHTRLVALGGGRMMTVDDVGDPDGVPILYLHGTPDSRLARHPDDGVATAAGVRLLAVDRPGYGGTDPLPRRGDAATGGGAGPGTDPLPRRGDAETGGPAEPAHATPDPAAHVPAPGGTAVPAGPLAPAMPWPEAIAADVTVALDTLGVDQCAVLAWSGGALTGLALAAGLPRRVAALGIVAGLVPRQAYDDPEVRAAAEGRLAVVELADVLPPGELGHAIAPMLAPYPCDLAEAAEHQAEQRDAAAAAELATVVGGAERMAAALVEAVRPGLAGVAADVEAQYRPLAVDLASIASPVRLWYGTDDVVTPPAFGRWYAHQMPRAELTIVDGATHYLAFTRWAEMLAALAEGGEPR
jgi:pimeloyl-ACP methyl ester carboxylesterase